MANHYWSNCSNGTVPQGATACGRDKDGTDIYVGRAFHEGDLLPAKIVPSKGGAFFSYGGTEHSVANYEALVASTVMWQGASGGKCPQKPWQCGRKRPENPKCTVPLLLQALVASTLMWQSTSGSHVPPGAMAVGQTAAGEPLYVGRVLHDSTLTLGKVHPSHGVCYIPYAGQELSFASYEILLSK